MVSFIPYIISIILLILVLEIVSTHVKIKNLSDMITISVFITLLILFFDVFAGKAPDYALLIFAFFIATGVMYCYWKQEEHIMPMILGLIYASIWLSMQLWISLFVVSLAVISTFIWYRERKPQT